MKKSVRHLYTDKVRYMARKNAGAIQEMTGVPASLIYRIREGTVKQLGEKTIDKLERAYDGYFLARMKQGGVNEDERLDILHAGERHDIYKALREAKVAARLVRDLRRHRDRNLDGYKPTWHTVKDIKKQMAKDHKRNVGDWVKYVKGVFAVKELPVPERGEVFTPRRMPKYKVDKKGHRHVSEKWLSTIMKGEDD
jgi:hypothetical protein